MGAEGPMRFSGVVRPGLQRGRQLGFPTANLEVDPQLAGQLPRGVFAGRLHWEGEGWNWAVINIGTRPTFAPGALSIEAHILDFGGDLYDKTLEVELLRRLREEKHFAAVEELIAQIGKDIAETRNIKNMTLTNMEV